ncbi:hypothetical protein AB0H12_22955 [Actinosynnema sp. NPDC023794]
MRRAGRRGRNGRDHRILDIITLYRLTGTGGSSAQFHYESCDRGGNFAAMEEPDLFIGDVREFRHKLKLG